MHNKAHYGDGGGIYCNNSSPAIKNCIIAGNWASSQDPLSDTGPGKGGGIYGISCTSAMKITNCTLRDNRGRAGGGVCNDSSSPDVIGCIFASNRVTVFGGGMYNRDILNPSNPKIANCVFIGNDAEEYGGGMENEISSPQVINCTFYENSTEGYGGGMDNWGPDVDHQSNPTITNCIFWDNTDESGSGESAQIRVGGGGGTATVTYSCIDDDIHNDDYIPFGGSQNHNIDDNPLFVDADDPDGLDGIFGTGDDGLRLGFGSPCIDAGDNDAVNVSTDIVGGARMNNDPYVSDTGMGDLPVIDMGAYEHIWWFPVGLKMSGGEFHTLLNRANRTVWACGDNRPYFSSNPPGPDYGQLGLGYCVEEPFREQWTVGQVWCGDMFTPSCYLENIVLLDSGFTHSLALDKDSYVWTWGLNSCGQVGDGSETGTVRATAVEVVDGEMCTISGHLEDIAKVAAGRSGQYSLALDCNKHVWAWGRNAEGQLGCGDTLGKLVPTQVKGENGAGNLENVVDVDAGISHSIALEDSPNRYVWCWGYNLFGQLGNGGTTLSSVPVKVKGGQQGGEFLQNIVDVAVCCGWYYGESGEWGSSYALESLAEGGKVWAWGDGNYGKLGQGPSDLWPHYTPIKVKAGAQNPQNPDVPLVNIVAISAGNHHVLALDSTGKVWAWGKNESGQLGNGEASYLPVPLPVQVLAGEQHSSGPLTDIVYIDAGFEHSLAMDKYGKVWVWGRNSHYELGLGKHPTNYAGYELTPKLMPRTR